MVTLEQLRRERRDEILRLADSHGCRNVRVFGSVARGDNTENSDLDLLVDVDEGRTLFDLAGFMGDVSDLLGLRVDIAMPEGLHYLQDRILAEATPL